MEKKTFPPRRSSTLLRRIASAALLMLTFHTAAMAITVTLKPGRGSGSDIVIDSEVSGNMASDWRSAAGGQFWFEGEQLYFKFPSCPGSYTVPGDDIFIGWSIDSEDGSALSPGSILQISQNLTLYAKWGTVEINAFSGITFFKCTVTNMSPREVSLIDFDYYDTSDFSIPASVEYHGEEYAVTGLADGFGKIDYGFTSLTIPATVRHIGSNVFRENSDLTTVTFAEGSQLETIGEYAFYSCGSLTSVYGISPRAKAPDNKTVFYDCPLKTLTIAGQGTLGDWFKPIIRYTPLIQWIPPFIEEGGAKWSTFVTKKCNFQADAATTVYTAELVGNTLQLHKIEDGIIESWTPVILKSTGNPVLTKTEAAGTVVSPNDLTNNDKDSDPSPWFYVLSGGAEGIGFYPCSGEKLYEGTVYVVIWPDMGVYDFVGMMETPDVGTTAIPCLPAQEAAQDEAAPWFTIDGRRLPARPTRPGIYIRSGRKAVIR